MSVTSIADLFLVALPNGIIIIQYIFPNPIFNSLNGFMFVLISIRSLMNFFVYFVLNKEFRVAFKKCFSRSSGMNAVSDNGGVPVNDKSIQMATRSLGKRQIGNISHR